MTKPLQVLAITPAGMGDILEPYRPRIYGEV